MLGQGSGAVAAERSRYHGKDVGDRDAVLY
jgi:hypothetical protein